MGARDMRPISASQQPWAISPAARRAHARRAAPRARCDESDVRLRVERARAAPRHIKRYRYFASCARSERLAERRSAGYNFRPLDAGIVNASMISPGRSAHFDATTSPICASTRANGFQITTPALSRRAAPSDDAKHAELASELAHDAGTPATRASCRAAVRRASRRASRDFSEAMLRGHAGAQGRRRCRRVSA